MPDIMNGRSGAEHPCYKARPKDNVKIGFYIILAAQFFSSLADNALLIAAIALLMQDNAPSWLTPYLKFFFVVSYVLLAPYVGAFADRFPKGQVMFGANAIKIAGCIFMLWGADPLVAYAVVGLGAAAYSPAKYGILTEYLPHRMLVIANGWIEGLTVASILLGTVLGGGLIHAQIAGVLLNFDLPVFDTPIDTPAEAAISVIVAVYAIAALFNLKIPRTGVTLKPISPHPVATLIDFTRCIGHLWRDRLGQISLAVTTLFWGAGACLQFIVIKWAERALRLPLEQGAMLSGVSAIGIAIGAMLAARFIPLKRATIVLPAGIIMGIAVISMTSMRWMPAIYAMLVLIGALAGFFVVPMNALLQHRGHVLMSAGHSIAVQNFNENVSILVMLALYALMIRLDFRIQSVIVIFGIFLAAAMYLVIRWNAANHRADPHLDRLIGEAKH
jgi:MFS family permease